MHTERYFWEGRYGTPGRNGEQDELCSLISAPDHLFNLPDIRGPEVSVEAAFSHESVLKLLPVESA